MLLLLFISTLNIRLNTSIFSFLFGNRWWQLKQNGYTLPEVKKQIKWQISFVCINFIIMTYLTLTRFSVDWIKTTTFTKNVNDMFWRTSVRDENQFRKYQQIGGSNYFLLLEIRTLNSGGDQRRLQFSNVASLHMIIPDIWKKYIFPLFFLPPTFAPPPSNYKTVALMNLFFKLFHQLEFIMCLSKIIEFNNKFDMNRIINIHTLRRNLIN